MKEALAAVFAIAAVALLAANYMALRETRVMVGVNRCMIEISSFAQGYAAFELCAQGTMLEEVQGRITCQASNTGGSSFRGRSGPAPLSVVNAAAPTSWKKLTGAGRSIACPRRNGCATTPTTKDGQHEPRRNYAV